MAQVRRNVIASQENVQFVGKNVSAMPATTGAKRSALTEISNNNIRKNVPARKPLQVPIKKPCLLGHPRKSSNYPDKKARSLESDEKNLKVLCKYREKETAIQKITNITSRPRPTLKKAASTGNLSKELIENIDKNDKDDPFSVTEYVNDVYDYLRQLEVKYPIGENFLAGQEITPKMRAILIDWLVEVQQQFHLLLETLYVSVSIIDRYLQEVPNVTRKNLQLLAAGAMFVACKYEEMYSPEVSDFVYICDNAYSKEQILRMEANIVQKLNFSFCKPIPLRFLRRYSKAAHATLQKHNMAKYLLELSLVDYSACHYSPSKISAAAMYLCLWLFAKEKKGLWTRTLVHYSTYQYQDIEPLVKKLASIASKASQSKYQAVNKKYAQGKFLKVSCMPELRSDELLKLASVS